MKEKIASFCKKYKHALLLLYFLFIFMVFRSEYFKIDYSIVHITLDDDKIPFIEALQFFLLYLVRVL